MRTQQALLTDLIGGIGEREFGAIAANSVRDFVQFELSAVLLHRRASLPTLMFDDFDAAGGRQGIENYVAVTHRVNPMLARAGSGPAALRARDFVARHQRLDDSLRPYLVHSADEELGFRTIGWPERLEEIGLYFEACGGVVELSLYRERGRHAAEAERLDSLEALKAPIAAAFDKHALLSHRAALNTQPLLAPLSPREAEVTGLLLLGCSSEAIALRLGIGRFTVKDHRKQIFRKLGIASLAELFALHRRAA